MTFKRQLTTFVAVLALMGAAAPVLVPNAEAAQAAQGKIGPKVGKPLQEAQQLANKGDFQGAMAKVNEAQAIESKTPAEQAVIYEFQGFVAIRLNDYETAAKAYAGAVDANLVPDDKLADHLTTLTKLEFQTKNYQAAIKYGNMALEKKPDPELADLVAKAYYIEKDYAGASQALKKQIDMAEKSQTPVSEETLKLLLSSEYNLKNNAGVMAAMTQLLQKYPSEKYWTDALNLVEDSGKKSDEDRLQVLRLKSRMTKMQAAEYVNMAQIALRQGVPGDAKNALEKGFAEGVLSKKDDSALLEESRAAAQKDKSTLPSQAKEIAGTSNGNAYLSLAEAFISYGQCPNAVDIIKQAMSKNIIKDADKANLDLGIAYACANNASEASATFAKIPAESKYGDLARLWTVALPQIKNQPAAN